MKRVCVLMLAVALCAAPSLFAAGSSQQAAARTPLRLLTVGDSAARSLGDDDRIVNFFEDRLNIDFSVDIVPQGEWERINVAIASGDFPDVVVNQYPSYAVRQWIDNEVIIPLNNYLDGAPTIRENAMDKESWAWQGDGNVYGYIFVAQKGVANTAMVYRGDYLRNLNLPVPRTLDEFYATMRAFTFDDPNGSGRADTYGITMQRPIGQFDFVFFAYGREYADWALDERGTVIPNFEHPSFREGMTFINRMWNEGLIDPEFMLNDRDTAENKFYQGRAGFSTFPLFRHVSRIEGNLKAVAPDAWIEFTGGPTGPNGHYGISNAGKSGQLTAVTAAARNPETAVQFIEFIVSPEGRDLFTLGIEGIHFTRNAAGAIQYNETERAADRFAANGWSHPLAWGYVTWPLESEYLPVTEPERDRALESVTIASDSQRPNLVPVTTDAEIEYGGIVNEIYQQYFMDMLTGTIGIDAGIRELGARWRDQGGDRILSDVNAAYRLYR